LVFFLLRRSSSKKAQGYVVSNRLGTKFTRIVDVPQTIYILQLTFWKAFKEDILSFERDGERERYGTL